MDLARILESVFPDRFTLTSTSEYYILDLLAHVRCNIRDCEDLEELTRVLPGQLASHAYNEVMRNKDRGTSSDRLVEYLAAEILEISATYTANEKKKRITIERISCALREDAELAELFKDILDKPMPSTMCKAVTRSGKPCTRRPQSGEIYCWQHLK